MNAPAPTVRQLNIDDAPLYREARLESLQRNPEAYGSTFENEKDHPLSWFENKISNNVIVGAFIDQQLMGIAGFYIQKGPKVQHKGVLWGMYVRSEARKMGLGELLVGAIVSHAKTCIEILQLNVVSDNASAHKLYERCGFVSYGIEKHALKQDGIYCDEILMAKPLT